MQLGVFTSTVAIGFLGYNTHRDKAFPRFRAMQDPSDYNHIAAKSVRWLHPAEDIGTCVISRSGCGRRPIVSGILGRVFARAALQPEG